MSWGRRGLISAAAVVLAGGAVYVSVNRARPAQPAPCAGGRLTVTVAAAPDIAPAVTAAASRWNATKPVDGGECVSAVVTSLAPADMASRLAARVGGTLDVGTTPSPATPIAAGLPNALPALWIPDSSSWLVRVLQVDNNALAGVPGIPMPTLSVAASPVVLAVRDADRQSTGLSAGTLSPAAAKTRVGQMRAAYLRTQVDPTAQPDRFQIGMNDPRHDATGLSVAVMLAGYDAATSGLPEYGGLVEDFRAIGRYTADVIDPAVLITELRDKKSKVTVAALSEQAVIAYDLTPDGTADPLDAVYVSQGLDALDYPAALIGGLSSREVSATQLFQSALASPEYQDLFATRGFRTPDGTADTDFPATPGVTRAHVPIASIPTADSTEIDLGVWSIASTPSRLMTLVNLSSTMNQASAVPPYSRLGLGTAAITRGLGLFTPDSELGMWGFAAGLGTAGSGYREMVPIAALDTDNGAQRQRLASALGDARATGPRGCALYPALVAAYDEMSNNYTDGRVNIIVVITDCAAGTPQMDLDQLLSTLQYSVNVEAPIPVVIINVGPAKNLPTLTKISSSVGGGQAFQLQGPDGILQVFMNALINVGG